MNRKKFSEFLNSIHWASDESRANDLHFKEKGSSIVCLLKDNTLFGYDNVINPSFYFSTIIRDCIYTQSEPNKIFSPPEIKEILNNKFSKIYAESYNDMFDPDNDNLIEVSFKKIWDVTKNNDYELFLEELRKLDENQPDIIL